MSAPMFAELAGNRIVGGSIVIPSYGACVANVMLDKEARLTSSSGLELALGTLRLKVSVWRELVPFQGKTSLRLIGGFGGWGKTIPAKPYKLEAGVKLSLVLGDAARAVGEKITIGADRSVGRFYVRDEAPACRLLNRLVPRAWWIDADGTTKTGTRPSSAIVSPFTILNFDGARGALTIDSEFLADWVPGRTCKGITLDKTITIGGITHTIEKTGVKTEVLAA